MKASKKARQAGFKTLKEMAEFTGESTQTLNNWNKHKPYRFEMFLKGAVIKRLELIK